MKKYQRLIILLAIVLLGIGVYFALYYVEGFSFKEINGLIDNGEFPIFGKKRNAYLSLFYLLSLAFLCLFISFIKNQKYLLAMFGVGIALYGWKLFTSGLTSCVRGYCSFYGYVDLLIYSFFALAFAYIISLLCLIGYYLYKLIKKNKK